MTINALALLMSENAQLRARIAQLESERCAVSGDYGAEFARCRRAEKAESRLAAVIALCDFVDKYPDSADWDFSTEVRAAATKEKP